MKKFLVFTVVLAVAFAFAFSINVIAADKGPAEMVLKTDAAKKPAKFPHANHQAKNPCSECHHSKSADGKQLAYVDGQKIEKCATCHNADMADKKLDSFKDAAHKRCKGCHKAKKSEGASTKCTTCHVKGLK